MEYATSRNEMFTACYIKEWCKNCSFILDFKQIFANIINDYSFNNFNITHRPMSNCKLCGDLIYHNIPFKDTISILCSDCYPISSGWIDQSLFQFSIYHGGIFQVDVKSAN
ncbi:hypothetical protein C1645_824488 [Glomus cerebriforme]|uniref:Uncharacterized protein n=1 Tax=Glomus cerebriforme TaxID=658196 RepID=A0A397T0T6_9GLOM|nr:hypothetical protein C1645_824488 [Glomus cerebriforme]